MISETKVNTMKLNVKKQIIIWIVVYFILISITLNNTKPYKGDESFYITSTINMIQTDNYLIPHYFGSPRFQKPPLTYWVVLLGYKLFGIHLWSGRLFFLIIAVLTLGVIYKFSLLIKDDPNFAFLNIILLSSATMFMEFTRHAMTDLLFTFFITATLYFFFKSLQYPDKLKKNYFFAFLSMGLAFATKGFLAIIPFFAMVLYLAFNRREQQKKYLINLFHPINLVIFSVLSFSWYLYAYVTHTQALMHQYQSESSHVSISIISIFENVLFYILVLIRYYIPVTVVAIYFYIKNKIHLPKRFSLIISYMFMVMFIFSFFLVRNKARYLLIIFPVLTLIYGYIIYESKIQSIMKKIAIGLCFFQILVFIVFPFISGEPTKALTNYWQENLNGNLAVYGNERKKISWAQAISHGKVISDHQKADYVILKEKFLKDFTDYEVIKTYERLKNIKVDEWKLKKTYRTYYLIRKNR